MTLPFVTTSSTFGQNGREFFFATVPGVSCADALNLASASLSSVEDLLGQLVQIEESCHVAFAIRALASQAKALIDSSVTAFELAEVPAPQNKTSPACGAEVSA